MPPYSPQYKSYRRRLRYHGQYCGPGWSAGQYRTSVCGGPDPIDDFDASCREHDCSYARGDDLSLADRKFFETNLSGGFKPGLAAIGVGVQGGLRSLAEKMYTPPRSAKKTTIQVFDMDDISMNSAVNSYRSVASSLGSGGGSAKGNSSEGYFNSKALNDKLGYKMNSAPGGCKFHKEIRFSVNGGEISWVGHHDMPYQETLNMFARAVTKQLLKQAGYDTIDWNDQIYGYLAGSTVTYFYAVNPQTSIENSLSYTINTTDTVNDLTNQLQVLWTAIGASGGLNDVNPRRVWLTKTVRNSANTGSTDVLLAGLPLDGLSFHVKTFSSLKVMNSSLSDIVDNADLTTNVNSVTLQGRMYVFDGNNAAKRGYNTIPFTLIADPVQGVVRSTSISPTGGAPFSEPVDSFQFFGCKQSSAIMMPPGAIKTSAFGHTKTVKLKAMLKNYAQKNASPNYGTNSMGGMHLLALEKKVQVVASTNLILLNCNLDWEITVCLSLNDNKISKPVTDHIDLAAV